MRSSNKSQRIPPPTTAACYAKHRCKCWPPPSHPFLEPSLDKREGQNLTMPYQGFSFGYVLERSPHGTVDTTASQLAGSLGERIRRAGHTKTTLVR